MSPPTFELVRASAGTGKTYRLVETYVRLMAEQALRPQSIVAITFTRKAALELRGRIRSRLERRGAAPDVLAELARAPINNFHGVALQLLTGAGPGAGVGERPRVLGDEGDDRQLFVEACEEAWLADDAEVAEEVGALARWFSVDGELPLALWAALARAREDGASLRGAELVRGGDPEALRRARAPALEELRERVRAALPSLKDMARACGEAFLAAAPGGNLPVGEWAERWARAAAALNLRTSIRQVVDRETRDEVCELPRLVRGELASADAAPLVARLLDVAWQRYERLKAERGCLDFADLVERAVALLESDAALRGRLSARYRAVLVDEAQDTNRLQRRFVHLLAGLADDAPASLAVVGDRKQAIYTFRGADPASFEAFARDVRDRGGAELTLEESWRSVPPLCEGINHLGRHLFPEGYEPIRAAAGAPPREGPGMRWLETTERSSVASTLLVEARAVAAHVAARVAAGEPAERFVILLAALTRAPVYLAALTEAGVPAVLGGGGGLYAEPEVLDLAALLAWAADRDDRLAAATALRSPLFAAGNDALFELFGPAAGEAFARLCQGQAPSLDGGDGEALALAARVMPRLWRAVKVLPPHVLLREALALLDYEAVLLALPSGEQRVARVRRLVELAERFAGTTSGDARRFARELRGRIDSGTREPLATSGFGGAVRLGTVHQAKGLEFPVVVLPDLAHRGRADGGCLRYSRAHGIVLRPRIEGEYEPGATWREADAAAQQEARAELARLLYVAVTRAEQEVVFVGAPVRRKGTGFAALLAPWRSDAAAARVLAIEAAPEPASGTPVARRAVQQPPDGDWAEAVLDEVALAPVPDGSRLTLPVTQLEAYLQCLRRGALRDQLGLEETPHARAPREEGDPPLDPLARGRLAHAVLAELHELPQARSPEAFVAGAVGRLGYDPSDPRLVEVTRDLGRFLASPLGRSISALDPAHRRHELPFVLSVDAAPFTVTINGQMDLLYWDGEGPVVLDFKHGRPRPSAIASYRLQLEIYAIAAAQMCGIEGPLRTQLVFIHGAGHVVASVVTAGERRALTAKIATLGRELVGLQRRREPWPGQPESECRSLGCGFVSRCHPSSAGAPAGEVVKTSA